MTGLGRRAKYLMADLGSGDVLLDASGHVRLVSHPARTRTQQTPGQFHHPRGKNGAHDHVVFHMSSGAAVIFNDPRRFGYMKIIARNDLDEEPLLRGLGPEPLGNEFDAAMLAASCEGKATSLEGGAARPARGGGAWQHLCLRGAVSRASVAEASGLDPGRPQGRADRSCEAAGRRHPHGAEPGDQGRRLVAARSSPDRSASSAISSTRFWSTTARAKNAAAAAW